MTTRSLSIPFAPYERTSLPTLEPRGVVRMRERCGLLKDGWYAAALSRELGARHPIARTILDQPLVLWRAGGGRAVAMEDRCAHRNAALSAGVLFDGKLGCAYHGWVYDADGRCVAVPSEGECTPSVECRVQSFPGAGAARARVGVDGRRRAGARPLPHAVLETRHAGGPTTWSRPSRTR